MGFWVFMLVCDLLIPIAMIVFGTRFVKKPPSRINSLYGYRTARSMKSQAAWDFAHRYCGKLWRAMGWAMLPLSVLAMLPALGRDADFTGFLGGAVAAVQTPAQPIVQPAAQAGIQAGLQPDILKPVGRRSPSSIQPAGQTAACPEMTCPDMACQRMTCPRNSA